MNNIMNLFINNKVAVSFDSKEAYNKFMKECDEHNLKWINGDGATECDEYRRDFCYEYCNGGMVLDQKCYYKDSELQIITIK